MNYKHKYTHTVRCTHSPQRAKVGVFSLDHPSSLKSERDLKCTYDRLLFNFLTGDGGISVNHVYQA